MTASAERVLESAGPEAAQRFRQVRARSKALAARLSPEDAVVQSAPECSPAKWHLAHTTWFWETFVCVPHAPGWGEGDATYAYLFNSYYESLGPRHARDARGLLTRPSLDEVLAYRERVDAGVEAALAGGDPPEALMRLGFAHEEQHQELLLMDVQHLFASQPLRPAYVPRTTERADQEPEPIRWVPFDGGLARIGADGSEPFAFDNEGPRHRVWLEPYALADRLVTNAEWLRFMGDGGYQRPELWLADGWTWAKTEGVRAPQYWEAGEGGWLRCSLNGREPLEIGEPVSHVSLYEADAFARWAGARLPTEAEWEAAAAGLAQDGVFLDAEAWRPRPANAGEGLRQMFGDLWEWTASAYQPYPGFRAAPGAVGEYNGKFMVNQAVLKGGCCATPPDHVRATYRNFFFPGQRWQFSGVRLAQDRANA